MIRVFNVYYPLRSLVLLAGEAFIVWTSFVLATLVQSRSDSYLVLNYEGGYLKIFLATAFVLLSSYWFDLYDPSRFAGRGELYFRILLVPALLAFALAVISWWSPQYLLGNGASLLGLLILTFALFAWRTSYSWLVQLPVLQERVYVLGTGSRAQSLVQGLKRIDLGIDVVGWTGQTGPVATREELASHMMELAEKRKVHRVIVAMPDRRGILPVNELLQLRLSGVKVEEATSWLEKISGRIEVEHLYPSWLIFSEGFRFGSFFVVLRRMLSTAASLLLLMLLLPLIPLAILLITLDSPGPVLYRQKRVGRAGVTFYCYKFRTMRQDAEADTGPTWADDNDPRITRVGRFLRAARIDEIPQLWCVLKGDMAFVGPRPERPEFVQWLSEEIPFYGVRHYVRPGITGWAQIRYKYGNTLADAKEKLQYDLFYIKNASLGLDFLIMLQTVKIVILGRGAQ